MFASISKHETEIQETEIKVLKDQIASEDKIAEGQAQTELVVEDKSEVEHEVVQEVEPDVEVISRPVTKLQQPEGFVLILSEIGGLTLIGKWIKAGTEMPAGSIAILRIAGEIDEYKLKASPLICGQNLRAQWTAQAKALCLYIKTCANLRGELELLPAFSESLPNPTQLICHDPDHQIKAILSPGVFDFGSHMVDAIAILPAGKDYFKRMSDVNTSTFIDVATRKGAALRL